MRIPKSVAVVLRVSIVASGMCGLARAADTFYVGAQLPISLIQGDFDNTNAPKVDSGIGIGVLLGYWLAPTVALEMSLSQSNHKSAGATISFQEISLNLRYLLSENKSMQPYVLLGYGQYFLGDGSLTFGGTGVRFGLGFDSSFTSKLSWGAALIRSVPSYDKITKGDGVTLVGSLRGDTTSLIFNIKNHF